MTYPCPVLFGCVGLSISHHVKALQCYLAVVTVAISLWRLSPVEPRSRLHWWWLRDVCVCVSMRGWALLSCHFHASEWDEAWHGARSPSSGCQSQRALRCAPLQEASLSRGLLSVLFILGWSAPWVELSRSRFRGMSSWVWCLQDCTWLGNPFFGYLILGHF